MTRPPRNTATGAAIIREIATLAATVAAQGGQITAIGTDAREARDGIIKIRQALDSENLAARIEDAKREARANLDALRADVVHAVNANRTTIDDLEGKVGRLEGEQAKLQGARGTLAQVGSMAVSILAAVGAVAAAIAAWFSHQH